MTTVQKVSKKNKNAPVLHAPVEAVEAAQPESLKGDAVMGFATQQLTAPVAPEVTVPPVTIDVNSEEFKALLAAALANRVPTVAKSKLPKTPRVTRVEQNGVKRPIAGPGICATMWATFDRVTAEQGSPCTIAQAKIAMPTLNFVNMQGEYASWRKFNGITGRIVAPVAPVVPKEETDGSDHTTS